MKYCEKCDKLGVEICTCSRRGGKRKGAGRPTNESKGIDSYIVVPITLPPEIHNIVTSNQNPGENKSQAIARIIYEWLSMQKERE